MATYSPRRWWALIALVLSMIVIGFDAMILNVAVPTMAAQLHAGTTEMQWIVDAYTLVFAAGMLPAGVLGDRFGRKKLLMGGLTVFLAASVLGTLTDDPQTLIAARGLMGLGAAFLMPLATAMINVMFPPEERTRAIAILTSSFAIGMPLGPILGGLLLDHFWWGSIFLINIPVILVALVAVFILVPESSDPEAGRVDIVGALMSVTGLALIIFGIIEAPSPDYGWTHPTVLGALAGGAATLTAFTLWERRVASPVMDLSLFRMPTFVGPTIAGAIVSFVMGGLLFVVPLYLQDVLGNDALGTGLRIVPMMAGLFVGALTIEKVATGMGHKQAVVSGLLVFAAGLGWGAFTEAGSGYPMIAGWLTVCGFGIGMSLPAAMDAALASLPENRSGMGTGLIQTLRQVGAAIGVAGLVSVLSTVYQDRLKVGALPTAAADNAKEGISQAAAMAARLHDNALLASAHESYVQGMRVVLVICVAASVLGALLIWFVMPSYADGAPGTADARESDHEHVAP